MIITGKSTEVIALGDVHKIDMIISDWTNAILGVDQEDLLDAGEQLYRLLVLPFEHHISGERLVIIPCGQLYNVSFEALNQHENLSSCLIYKYDIGYDISINKKYDPTSVDHWSSKGPVVIAPGFESAMKDRYFKTTYRNEFPDSTFFLLLRQPFSCEMANFGRKKIQWYGTASAFSI